MKVKRCPICLGELLKADDVCPQCGKIHYQIGGASLMDRKCKKTIQNIAFNHPILYVADNLFAFDKDNSSGTALTSGGAAGFGVVGALVGGLADDAIGAAKRSLKKKSSAICYDWKNISDIVYPMKPMQVGLFHMNIPIERGIDLKFKDGSELTITVGTKTAEDLYQVMNMLLQKSIAQGAANQGGNVISHTAHTAASDVEIPKTSVHADTIQEKKVQQPSPASFAGLVSGSGTPKFFKCAYCGVTQLREGDFCAYCGKPAPALEPPKQNAPSDAGVVTCPRCGNRQEAGSKYCFQCGQKLAAEPTGERSCPHCGARVKDGMLFCMECGTRI